jgi:transposase
VGPVLASVFVAEIGGVERIGGPSQLASWSGLTPKHRESDTTLHRGPNTKQGSRLVRWAARSSRSSTTGCATTTSVSWPKTRRDEVRTSPGARSFIVMAPVRWRGRPLD